LLRYVPDIAGGRAVEADGPALIHSVVTDVARAHDRVPHDFLFHREVPVVNHRIHQIRIDSRGAETSTREQSCIVDVDDGTRSVYARNICRLAAKAIVR